MITTFRILNKLALFVLVLISIAIFLTEYTNKSNAQSNSSLPSNVQDIINEIENSSQSSSSSSASTTASKLLIQSPREGELVNATNLLISGRGPINTIVNITIKDEDLENAIQQHNPEAYIYGVATSDKQGNWVFVPQRYLEIGKYSVTASYLDPQQGNILSEKIYFSVSTSSGDTFRVKTWLLYMGSAIGILLVGIAAYLFFVRRRKVFNFVSSIPVDSRQANIVQLQQPVNPVPIQQLAVPQPIYVQLPPENTQNATQFHEDDDLEKKENERLAKLQKEAEENGVESINETQERLMDTMITAAKKIKELETIEENLQQKSKKRK